jgi:hypothetical protein
MKWLRSVGALPIGAALCLVALAAVLTGRWNYYNYKGALVFAPAAVIVGLLMMAAAKKGSIFGSGLSRQLRAKDPCDCGSGRKFKNCCGRRVRIL